MSMVPLVSGGLDSTLMTVMAKESGIEVHPLFVDYGQLSRERELAACQYVLETHGLPQPEIADVSGYGRLIPSGLTNTDLDIYEEAFLPGRNLMFLLLGAAYAYKKGAKSVGIALLNEGSSLFLDQTRPFADEAEALLSRVLERPITVLTPLMSFSKKDVIQLAEQKGIAETYSCHSGSERPCGRCIACREFQLAED